ncbi:MAG: serine acetyltransferase [Deltaproteobacteria bacterium]|nr:serine acetyltransferase [Deltaproteobacteria bacterium]
MNPTLPAGSSSEPCADRPHQEPSGEECPQGAPFREELPGIVAGLLESCRDPETFHHVNLVGLPSREAVARLLEGFRRILFPGYFGDQEIDHTNLSFQLGIEVNRLFDLLSQQITLSIRHECRRYQNICTQCLDRGQREAVILLKKMAGLRRLLADDVRAAYQGDPAAKSFDEIIFSYPSLAAITAYRIAHELVVQDIPLLPRMMSEHTHSLTGIDIHPGARIGRHFFIDHGTGVVIGETSVIGDRVRVYQGVTLGALSLRMDEEGDLLRKSKRHPTIEDGVTIYSGATILGGKTIIGAGSIIGGNVWLTRSVPPGTTVLIEPPQLRYKGDKID